MLSGGNAAPGLRGRRSTPSASSSRTTRRQSSARSAQPNRPRTTQRSSALPRRTARGQRSARPLRPAEPPHGYRCARPLRPAEPSCGRHCACLLCLTELLLFFYSLFGTSLRSFRRGAPRPAPPARGFASCASFAAAFSLECWLSLRLFCCRVFFGGLIFIALFSLQKERISIRYPPPLCFPQLMLRRWRPLRR